MQQLFLMLLRQLCWLNVLGHRRPSLHHLSALFRNEFLTNYREIDHTHTQTLANTLQVLHCEVRSFPFIGRITVPEEARLKSIGILNAEFQPRNHSCSRNSVFRDLESAVLQIEEIRAFFSHYSRK